MNKIALGYLRVSTPKQVQYGNSLKNQEQMITKYAKNHDLNLTIYADKGISGYFINKRPKLNLVINKIKNNEVNILIISKLDRLSRNAKDMIEIMQICQRHNVEIISLMDNISTNNNLMMNLQIELMGAVAEFQRSIIKENVMSSIQYKYKNNIRLPGAVIPLGYKANNNIINIVKKEANAIKKSYILYAQYHYGYRKIANWLNNHYNIDYSIQGIKKVLSNPIYIGKSSSRSYPEYKIFPAIVDEKLFNKVQKIMVSKRKSKVIRNDPLKKILYCPICNHRLGFNYVNHSYEYYYCWYGIDRANTNNNFHRFRINARSVKKTIFKYIIKNIEDEKFLDKLTKKIKELLGVNKTNINNIYKQFENNQITIEDFKNRLSRLSDNSVLDNQLLVLNLKELMKMDLHDILSIIINKIVIDISKGFVHLYIGSSNIKIYL